MADSQTKPREILKHGLLISRTYLLTTMVKYPSLFATNGIVYGILSILVIGGICSTLSNLILLEVTANRSVNTYSALVKSTMGRLRPLGFLLIFIQRSLFILYATDLNFKLLQSIEFVKFSSENQRLLFLLVLNLLFIFIFYKPEYLNFASSRNLLTWMVLSAATVILAFQKLTSSSPIVHVELHAKGAFKGFGLICICFAQQITTTPICAVNFPRKKTSICVSGMISVFAYMSIGICGYLYKDNPDTNWLLHIKNKVVKGICSSLLVLVNLLSFPLAMEPIKQNLSAIKSHFPFNTFIIFSNIFLTIIYTYCSVYLIKTKHMIYFTQVISTLIMIVLPSFFYFRQGKKETVWKVACGLNLLVGSFLIYNGVYSILK